MKFNENRGVSMVTLVVTIVIVIILAAIALGGSTKMIDDSVDAKESANASEENDIIRSLLTYAITDDDLREGIELVDDVLVVIGSGDKEYGSGYYLIPGGTDKEMEEIKSKTGNENLRKYKDFTAPYVVDYDNGKFERIEEIRFK